MDINLSLYERINLLNQYTILQELSYIQNDEHNAKHYETIANIIANGYTHEYGMLTDCMSDEFPETEAQFVWDTLKMYSAILLSYHNIENPELTYEQILFPGFDGNNETQYLYYCEFVLQDMGRYGELSENNRKDFNSHFRKCDKYRAMLKKWNEMDKPHEMNQSQLKELLNIY